MAARCVRATGSNEAFRKQFNDFASKGDVSSVEKMFRHRVPPPPPPPPTSNSQQPPAKIKNNERFWYNMVLKSCAKSGNVNVAREWAKKMTDNQIFPNKKSFGKLVEAAAKCGDVHSALEWFNKMIENGF
eukprot:gene1182-648_t